MSVLDEAKAALTKWNVTGCPPQEVADALAALVVEYETLTTAQEWEYGTALGFGVQVESLDRIEAWDSIAKEEGLIRPQIVRRRPAGPWEVVEDAQ